MLAGLSLLAGCVMQPRSDLPPDLVARRHALLALDNWIVDGRIAMRFDNRGFTGALNWQQRDDLINARFHGPLGAGAFTLTGSAEAIVVETGSGEVYDFSDPENMMREQFGWTVPVAAMRYWLLGVPDPGLPAIEEVGEDGHLASLQQRGWRIAYDRYTEVGPWEMPRKIVLERDNVTIRLAVHGWNLAPN